MKMKGLIAVALILASCVAWPDGTFCAESGEKEAMAVLARMTGFLGSAERFSVTADIGFDAVQDTGEKIEFGETRRLVLCRPDRLRVEETKRDGSVREVVFDGKTISAVHPARNIYASAARPGSIDDAIDYFVDGLGMRLPLSEFISARAAAALPKAVRRAAYVETAYMNGVPCDHIILYGDTADMQLWVAQGDRPLPQRVVITYVRAKGQPQFRSELRDWDLKPDAPDSLFAFVPPQGAKKVAFSPKQEERPGEGAAKEGTRNENE